MTHEFKNIVTAYLKALEKNKKCILATVVDLDGSSYRRPGVRMLITEDGEMTGALSGGCIEKDVYLESASVFKSGQAKMMAYDGRYRLGCEGVIYILIEIFNPSSSCLTEFTRCMDQRQPLTFTTSYTRELISDNSLGTVLSMSGRDFALNPDVSVESLKDAGKLELSQVLPPMFQLVIFGGEYDAARLSMQASLLGWQVLVVTNPFDGYTEANFPGSAKVLQATANQLPDNLIDEDTAAVMMTHNYAKDLSYLLAIKNSNPAYLGLLGPVKRKNKLFDDFMENEGEIPDNLLNVIHGPAGLNIGAETAEEIALSICSEIITILQNKDASHLNDISDEIHAQKTD